MMRYSYSTWMAVACSALLMMACDPDNGDTSGNGGAGGGNSPASSTAATGGAGGAGGGTGGGVSCDYSDVEVDSEVTIESDNGLRHQGFAGFNPAGTLISLEMVYSFGANSQPHTFTEWENYATCHTCIILGRSCTDTDCMKVFEVQSGTLEITTNENGSMPGQFTGSLTNAEAVEVVIDPNTLESTPVENGEHWCIDAYNFDVTTVPPG